MDGTGGILRHIDNDMKTPIIKVWLKHVSRSLKAKEYKREEDVVMRNIYLPALSIISLVFGIVLWMRAKNMDKMRIAAMVLFFIAAFTIVYFIINFVLFT
jgi:hypothetical protein